MALDLYVVFPFDAVPGQVDEATITRMGIVAGPIMALSAMFAVFIYSRYDLTAARHHEILVELENRTSDRNPSD